MTTAIVITLAAILALLLLSAFFSGAETALTAASRSRLHQLAEGGDRRARLVGRLIERREPLIGAILLGNNAVNILASALATSLAIGFFGEPGVAWATIAMTLLVFVFAEVLPKTWAIRHADRMALTLAPGVRVAVSVLAPVSRTVHRMVDVMLRLADRRAAGLGAPSTADELRGLFDLRAHEGLVRKNYRDMLRSILDLSEVEVGEIMTHRKNMVTVDADLPAEELIAVVLDSPFTRIPAWRGDSDNVVGVLHAKRLLHALHGRDAIDSAAILKLAYEPSFVPDTTSLAEQLAVFRARREHFALVVDEYGTLQGLVTLEDILEEIVGDIADEYDRPTSGIRREADNSFVVEGAVTIRDLNRALDSRLPDEEAATAAGLVLNLAETIPEVGETFAVAGYDLEVLAREKNRITRLRLTSRPVPEETD